MRANRYGLEDGHFDRPALAGVIFSDDKKRELLNEVVHPAVKEYVLNAVKEAKKDGLFMLVLEAALLIEEGYGEICDELWYIYASEEVRRKSLSHQEAIQMRRLTVSLQASLKKLSTEGTARRLLIMMEISKTR